jgi:hypothetical protein
MQTLDTPIHTQITSYLRAADLCSLSSADKYFHTLLHNEFGLIWNILMDMYFPKIQRNIYLCPKEQWLSMISNRDTFLTQIATCGTRIDKLPYRRFIKSDLQNKEIIKSHMEEGVFTGSNFGGTYIKNSFFSNANLDKVNFTTNTHIERYLVIMYLLGAFIMWLSNDRKLIFAISALFSFLVCVVMSVVVSL